MRNPDYFVILADVVVVMEQQVGYKTGNKPGSRLQNSLKPLRHQEKDTPSPYSVSGAETKCLGAITSRIDSEGV